VKIPLPGGVARSDGVGSEFNTTNCQFPQHKHPIDIYHDRSPTLKTQLSIINYQLSIINYQLSIIN
jgi:hypothetical protein